ncbi:hypothetical protein FAI41_00080 [Acetobacteraceae bacterium]|nr:hypothetical protein FAI41_00080 [Acetobacteraceae bacterium]
MERIPVLILSGSRLGEEDILAKAGGVPHKALLPVGNIPMVERVYRAIKNAEIDSKIFVASEDEEWIKKSNLKDVTFIPSRPNLPETIFTSLEITGYPCLVVTADHALLEAKWLHEFLFKSKNFSADLTCAIVLKESVENIPFKSVRTYISLSDIQFSGCNLFLLKNPSSKKIVTLWKEIYHLRKSPLRMVRILGFTFLLRALFRRLSSSALLGRIKALTNASLEFVILEDGHAAIDVDKIADWELVEALIKLKEN